MTLGARLRAGAAVAALVCTAFGCENSTQVSVSDPAGGELGDTGDTRLLIHPLFSECSAGDERSSLSVLSWNIAVAERSSLDDVVSVLEDADADLVLLQEVDVDTDRSGGVNQAEWLAERLGLSYVFAASLEHEGGHYGLAILSALPIASARRLSLRDEKSSEPRIALDVRVCVGDAELTLLNAHADYMREAAEDQLEGLALGLGDMSEESIVLAGDFNLGPESAGVETLIRETQTVDLFDGRDESPTRGNRRIDYVLAGGRLDELVESVRVIETVASDHRPLKVEFSGL